MTEGSMADEKVRPQATPTREHMGQRAGLVIGLALCAASCAAASRPAAEWVKTRESAEDFDRSQQTCKEQASAEVNKEARDSIATQAGVGSFSKCMKDKGWTQVLKPTPAAAQ